jgi:Fic family protein
MESILQKELYAGYLDQLPTNLEEAFSELRERPWSAENFTFATAVSVMASSRIEGETLEVDSYLKHKMLNVEYLPDLTEKPNDLYEAYEFARDHALNKSNFETAHQLCTQHLLPVSQRGKVRTGNMVIMEQHTQRIQYEAASSVIVSKEYDLFWKELDSLLSNNLAIQEVFYHASLIHLIFVKIHPFNDGNGRTARLLEKWFLSHFLGEKAWFVSSELYYYQHLEAYYANLARVGLFYHELDMEKSLPFLQMLPNSLRTAK